MSETYQIYCSDGKLVKTVRGTNISTDSNGFIIITSGEKIVAILGRNFTVIEF